MINISTARALVEKELSKMSVNKSSKDEYVIAHVLPIDDIGWVFFYTTRAFFETQDPEYALIGNAPFIVDKEDGSFQPTGSGGPFEEYVEEFRQKKLSR